MDTRRKFLTVLGASALGVPFASLAQRKAAGIPRIGYPSVGSELSNGAFLGAFRDGLREFGFVDGKNVIIDVRWAGTAAYEFPGLAASLVKAKPADLPVEQPTRIEFALNLATVRKIGLKIPSQLLVRADRTIE